MKQPKGDDPFLGVSHMKGPNYSMKVWGAVRSKGGKGRNLVELLFKEAVATLKKTRRLEVSARTENPANKLSVSPLLSSLCNKTCIIFRGWMIRKAKNRTQVSFKGDDDASGAGCLDWNSDTNFKWYQDWWDTGENLKPARVPQIHLVSVRGELTSFLLQYPCISVMIVS